MAKRSDKKTTPRGMAAFLEVYATYIPNKEILHRLIERLSTPTPPILRMTPGREDEVFALWQSAGLTTDPLPWFPSALRFPRDVALGTPLPGNDTHAFYPMNASSLLPPLALDAGYGDTILDACAAPGGKTLVIADMVRDDFSITANDISPARRMRMAQVFKDFNHPHIRITHHHAETIFRLSPEAYDRILLDAPCSSEKHVLRSPRHLSEWSPWRIRQLQTRQRALISGLFRALKPGGRMVYSTCAITPEENEVVIADFLNRNPSAMLVPPPDTLPGDSGMEAWCSSDIASSIRRIWPDDLFDPMVFAIIEKQT